MGPEMHHGLTALSSATSGRHSEGATGASSLLDRFPHLAGPGTRAEGGGLQRGASSVAYPPSMSSSMAVCSVAMGDKYDGALGTKEGLHPTATCPAQNSNDQQLQPGQHLGSCQPSSALPAGPFSLPEQEQWQPSLHGRDQRFLPPGSIVADAMPAAAEIGAPKTKAQKQASRLARLLLCANTSITGEEQHQHWQASQSEEQQDSQSHGMPHYLTSPSHSTYPAAQRHSPAAGPDAQLHSSGSLHATAAALCHGPSSNASSSRRSAVTSASIYSPSGSAPTPTPTSTYNSSITAPDSSASPVLTASPAPDQPQAYGITAMAPLATGAGHESKGGGHLVQQAPAAADAQVHESISTTRTIQMISGSMHGSSNTLSTDASATVTNSTPAEVTGQTLGSAGTGSTQGRGATTSSHGTGVISVGPAGAAGSLPHQQPPSASNPRRGQHPKQPPGAQRPATGSKGRGTAVLAAAASMASINGGGAVSVHRGISRTTSTTSSIGGTSVISSATGSLLGASLARMESRALTSALPAARTQSRRMHSAPHGIPQLGSMQMLALPEAAGGSVSTARAPSLTAGQLDQAETSGGVPHAGAGPDGEAPSPGTKKKWLSKPVWGRSKSAMASLTSMLSVTQAHLAGATAGSASAATSQATSTGNKRGMPVGAAGQSEGEKVARRFAEAFVKALLTGDAKWGGGPDVGGLMAEDAVMVAHDGQRFIGRTAVIRRLNAGMEQFLKMLGVPVEEAGAQEGKVAERGEASDGGASSNASPAAGQSGVRDAIAARVAQVEVTLEVSHMPAPGHTLSSPHGRGLSTGSGSSLFTKPSAVVKAGAIMKQALLFLLPSASKPSFRAGSKRRQHQAAPVGLHTGRDAASGEILVVDYTFKAGLRRFKLRDLVKVKGGRITRLRRLRQ